MPEGKVVRFDMYFAIAGVETGFLLGMPPDSTEGEEVYESMVAENARRTGYRLIRHKEEFRIVVDETIDTAFDRSLNGIGTLDQINRVLLLYHTVEGKKLLEKEGAKSDEGTIH